MATTKDGKHKSSKFRANRYDREHESDSEKEPKGGPRAQANRMQAHGEGNPESHYAGHAAGHAFGGDDEGSEMAEEHAEEAIHPGIHDEVKQITADHGPAHTVHMTHDHEGMRSHVHSIHADGHEHHADHEGEGHHVNAHHHAMHAAGVPAEHIHGGDQEASGNYPAENEPPGEEEYGEAL